MRHDHDVAICVSCGNSIGNGLTCARCGSSRLSSVDPIVAGTSGVQDQRSVDVDWDEAATRLTAAPSKASMREVKAQARARRRASRQAPKPPKARRGGGSRQWIAWLGAGLVVLLLILITHRRWGPPPAPVRPTTAARANVALGAGLAAFFGSLLPILLVVIALHILICVLVAKSAERKGRNFLAWFFLAWFFPVISWIIVATMTPSPELIAQRDYDQGRALLCPNCREIVKVGARVCRFCGSPLYAQG